LCDSSDAYSEYDDGHGFCFSCQGYVESDDKVRSESTGTYQYTPWRGVHSETFRRYGSQTKVSDAGTPISIGFRYPNGDYQVRNLANKSFYWVKSGSKDKPGLFGRDKFAAGSHDCVIVTEGALDAHSLYQVLHVPCVAVVSATSAVGDCTLDRSYLNSYKRIYLAFDSDTPGREATARVAKLFDFDKVWDVRFSNRKDANEYLEAGESESLREIFHNSRKYLPETLVSSLADFDEILSEEPERGIPYPFKTLTEKTKGIRLGEASLITAQEGVGKTEIMHAIEYSLLQNTNENIGAIFNEEVPKRHLEALAGIRLQRPVHLPDSGCTRDQVREALREVVGKDDRLYVYRNFGSDDPEILLDTIRFLAAARSCRYILLDHISMVVSGLSTDDERRKLDYISTKLEMMVKELNFSLIVVSHVNDLGQTRGSRYIAKVFGVRIDVTRDVLNPDPVVSRIIRLTLSKNRPAWQTGPAGVYLFDPLTNTYTEIEDDSPQLSGRNDNSQENQDSGKRVNTEGNSVAQGEYNF
jgi:twinkle protein